MRNEKVSFQSDNLNLFGEIFFPDTENSDYPVLCFCHGIPAVAYNPAERGYAVLGEYFCFHGFIAFVFNFRGAGPSQGNFDMLGWSHDLRAAIDYLYSRNEIKEKKLAVVGFSGGAAVSIYVAASDQRVSAVATLACPATFDFLPVNKMDTVIKHFRTIGVIKDDKFPTSMKKWEGSFTAVSPINYIDLISPRPLLLLHGEKDETVPVEQAHILFNKARDPKNLYIISGAGHRLRLDARAIDAVLKWLKETYN